MHMFERLQLSLQAFALAQPDLVFRLVAMQETMLLASLWHGIVRESGFELDAGHFAGVLGHRFVQRIRRFGRLSPQAIVLLENEVVGAPIPGEVVTMILGVFRPFIEDPIAVAEFGSEHRAFAFKFWISASHDRVQSGHIADSRVNAIQAGACFLHHLLQARQRLAEVVFATPVGLHFGHHQGSLGRMPFLPDHFFDEQRLTGRINDELKMRGDRIDCLPQSAGTAAPAIDLEIIEGLSLLLLLQPLSAVFRQGVRQSQADGFAESPQNRLVVGQDIAHAAANLNRVIIFKIKENTEDRGHFSGEFGIEEYAVFPVVPERIGVRAGQVAVTPARIRRPQARIAFFFTGAANPWHVEHALLGGHASHAFDARIVISANARHDRIETSRLDFRHMFRSHDPAVAGHKHFIDENPIRVLLRAQGLSELLPAFPCQGRFSRLAPN